MIRTGNYKDFKDTKYLTVSISGDRGKGANYDGNFYSPLAPKLSFWNVWHNNIGKISEEENNRYYIEEYYKQVLTNLDPEEVYNKLRYNILLCYEDSNQFCHRHIAAAWFELMLGVKVFEVVLEKGLICDGERPSYIKEYLEDIIKSNKNMRGFNSLRALYLFEQGEEQEVLALKYEEEAGKSGDNFRQNACYLRCEADEEEEKYNELKNQKILKK